MRPCGSADDDATLAHNDTNMTITSGKGNLVIDNTVVTGSTQLQLGTDTLLLDVDEHELTGWALVYMRLQIELGIDDADAAKAEDADVNADDEEE